MPSTANINIAAHTFPWTEGIATIVGKASHSDASRVVEKSLGYLMLIPFI
jgi:hypothetical protein